jgi:stage II sporulation protein M
MANKKIKRSVKKKERNKQIDYFKFNISSLLFLLGIILFSLNLFYRFFILGGASLEINVYVNWISLALIYFGLISHLTIIGDNPFFKGFKYLKDSDNYVAVVAGVFVLFFMFGFVFPYVAPAEVLEPVLEEVRKLIKELIEKTEGKGFTGMFGFIFGNNVAIAFIAIMSGFLLAIVPVFLLMSNGFMIGLISSLITAEAGFLSLWRLFPHGIFEIPAIIISFAIGIRFGAFILRDDKLKAFKFRLLGSARVFFLIVVPLLVVAAIIESVLIVFVG